ncbi:MAG: sulfur carrier protein ThiS [Phycisphaeraceae bacterium]|nr:sulfur carrier protein ThiS [Phycisphaeraceae bacterium]
MKLKVNGKDVEVEDNLSVFELLTLNKVTSPSMVSVELNGSILDRQVFERQRLQDGDTVEFLFFMGGGR